MNTLQDLIDAASLGSMYALYSLSVAMIFGVARVINFANGALLSCAGFGLLLAGYLGGPVAVLASIALVMALSLLMERLAFRPVISAPMPTLMVLSLGLNLLLQSVLLIIFGSRPRPLPMGNALGQPVEVGGLTVPALDLLTIAVTAGLGVALVGVLRFTAAGLQLRAAAEDFGMARMVGVRANRVVAFSFAISGALAGVAGIILALKVGTASYTLGSQAIIIGFIATVIGGLGSIAGAALGGFLLGFATVAAQVLLPPEVSAFRDVFVFGVVILILLFRPQGLIPAFGRSERA